MASPHADYSDVVTTTLAGYSHMLADNVTNHNALLKHIDDKGNKLPASGRVIVQELEYGENTTVKYYSGYEVLDTSPSEILTAAEYAYKQLAGNVVVSGLETIQNSGREAIHNLVKARVRNLEKSMRNVVARDLYSDGTGDEGKQIGGLQLLVADIPTNTVGGIDAGQNGWWRNKVYDFTTETGSASSSSKMQEAMNQLWLQCTRGADKPDCIVMDDDYFKKYWSSLQANQRFVTDTQAGAGFMSLMFMSAPVYYDDQCPDSHGYFLNTDYLFLRPAQNREFVPLQDRASINQDAVVMPVVWAGNMTTSNRSLQGVMKE